MAQHHKAAGRSGGIASARSHLLYWTIRDPDGVIHTTTMLKPWLLAKLGDTTGTKVYNGLCAVRVGRASTSHGWTLIDAYRREPNVMDKIRAAAADNRGLGLSAAEVATLAATRRGHPNDPDQQRRAPGTQP
ncbi:MAG: hypothetical protein BWY57_00613 [Betaproteobacteria bacterium ADurb.Bin341]|nr:MAG: hypothetical protein BWY57_00613 [Betaproteobacteria bacterium ADurb.Bin341]